MLVRRGVPFPVNVCQGVVDILQLWSEAGQISTYIGGDLFATMHTGVFLDMGSHFLGNGVVMAEDRTEKLLHRGRFWGSGRLLFWGRSLWGDSIF